MATALVTGATAGLGRSFAEQLAGHGHDLVIVARNEARLRSTADQIARQYRVQCEVIVADLADLADTDAVAARLSDPLRPVDWLVNNAGFGIRQGFAHSSVADEQRMLDVLVRAPMRLTHAALPGMVERGRGRVLIVSSVAGFLPTGTYSAAKAWATNFAEGLSGQFRSSGVHVTALCPGFTRTEFHERAEMDVTGVPQRLWLDADAVAEAGLVGCEQGKPLVVPGGIYKGIYGLARALPRPALNALLRRMG